LFLGPRRQEVVVNDFPPRDYLAHVAGAIARRLANDYEELLATERFTEEAALLERLRRPEHVSEGVAYMEPAEAGWLAERLLARWARVADVELGPAVAIVGPDQVWLGDEPQVVTLRLATLGIEDGWDTEWMGDVSVAEDGRSAELKLYPPDGRAPSTLSVGVRLIGRVGDERRVLSALRSLRLRRPVVTLDESRRQLDLRDQSGEPGARVELEVAGETFASDETGSLMLPQPLPEGASLRVGGVAVDPHDAQR
jgi:hypothetical protein